MELLQRSFHLRSCLRARMSWQRLWPKVRQKLLAQPGDCSTVDGMGRSRRRWNWKALRFPPAQVRRMDAKVLRLSCESARQSFREDKETAAGDWPFRAYFFFAAGFAAGFHAWLVGM